MTTLPTDPPCNDRDLDRPTCPDAIGLGLPVLIVATTSDETRRQDRNRGTTMLVFVI